ILIYRRKAERLEVLLVHPGGPFWSKKDQGAWSIPKGEPAEGEDLLVAARRELREETGIEPAADFIDLGTAKQKSGKTVWAWAVEADANVTVSQPSNVFELEWPPHSGKRQTFPEIDRAEFFSAGEAEIKINPAQRVFLERLRAHLT
ncbi:MAG TPA: NUDIX domain-containing protein, partial [Terrimicrobiaceae bacterium]